LNLSSTRQIEKKSGAKAKPIVMLEMMRNQINVHTLFDEFMRLKDFECGEGIVMPDTPTWLLERKMAYRKFQEKFTEQKMNDLNELKDNFKEFLLFRNNRSWTILYRTGNKALSNLEKLRRLLLLLQDESVPIHDRINRALQQDHIDGIGIAILTGLLHTFHPDEYGVLNRRTIDALDILRRKTRTIYGDEGESYTLVNSELKQLAREMNTELTTIDGFMWYISKRIKMMEP